MEVGEVPAAGTDFWKSISFFMCLYIKKEKETDINMKIQPLVILQYQNMLCLAWKSFKREKDFRKIKISQFLKIVKLGSRSKVCLKSLIRDLDLELEAIIAMSPPPPPPPP